MLRSPVVCVQRRSRMESVWDSSYSPDPRRRLHSYSRDQAEKPGFNKLIEPHLVPSEGLRSHAAHGWMLSQPTPESSSVPPSAAVDDAKSAAPRQHLRNPPDSWLPHASTGFC